MIRNAHLLYVCIFLSNVTCYGAHAQALPADTYTQLNASIPVLNLPPDEKKKVLSTDTYTQLNVSIPALNLPPDEKKKKQAFYSIINRLGFGKKTRKISVSVKVEIGQVNLPEQGLMSYGFDAGSNNLETDINKGGISFPLKKLGANDKIIVSLIYRDATSAQYNAGAIASVVTTLIPGSSLINEANAPMIQSVFELSSATWNAMASQSKSRIIRAELSPYISGKEAASIPLDGPDGVAFGTVNLSLYSTFSLLNPVVIVTDFDSSGMKRHSNEMHTNLLSEVGGVRQSFSAILRSESRYTQLFSAPSSNSIREFCSGARELLNVKYGLTFTDSTYITHGVLSDAGFWESPKRLEWFNACFNPAEIKVLNTQNSISPPQKVELRLPAEVINARKHLFAFGCWMIEMADPDCATKAPDPINTLTSILSDNVRLDVDSAFLSTTSLGVHSTMSKGSVIELLSSTANSFSCFQQGMLVTSRGGQTFRFEGDLLDGRITAIRIIPVSDTTLTCTG